MAWKQIVDALNTEAGNLAVMVLLVLLFLPVVTWQPKAWDMEYYLLRAITALIKASFERK